MIDCLNDSKTGHSRPNYETNRRGPKVGTDQLKSIIEMRVAEPKV